MGRGKNRSLQKTSRRPALDTGLGFSFSLRRCRARQKRGGRRYWCDLWDTWFAVESWQRQPSPVSSTGRRRVWCGEGEDQQSPKNFSSPRVRHGAWLFFFRSAMARATKTRRLALLVRLVGHVVRGGELAKAAQPRVKHGATDGFGVEPPPQPLPTGEGLHRFRSMQVGMTRNLWEGMGPGLTQAGSGLCFWRLTEMLGIVD